MEENYPRPRGSGSLLTAAEERNLRTTGNSGDSSHVRRASPQDDKSYSKVSWLRPQSPDEECPLLDYTAHVTMLSNPHVLSARCLHDLSHSPRVGVGECHHDPISQTAKPGEVRHLLNPQSQRALTPEPHSLASVPARAMSSCNQLSK